ncbi:MAG: hypothetical protein ACP5QR_17920, partial [Rhizomicrobium sp.]
ILRNRHDGSLSLTLQQLLQNSTDSIALKPFIQRFDVNRAHNIQSLRQKRAGQVAADKTTAATNQYLLCSKLHRTLILLKSKG